MSPSAQATHRRRSHAESDAIAWNLVNRGFYVFPNALPSRRWFAALYDAFDIMAERLAREPALLDRWHSAADRWLSEGDHRAYWCSVPPTFKDRSAVSGKRDKAYLQYCVQFASWLSTYEPDLVRCIDLAGVFARLEELHATAAALFAHAVAAVVSGDAVLRARLLPANRTAPIVLKTIRYNPNETRFGTEPHYDKSALSLLLDSDDREVRYRVGRFSERPVRYSELAAPIVYPARDDEPSHAVLLTGACLREIGLRQFGPSPHSVMPVSGPRPRHSVVAFHLVPHLDGSSVDTGAPFVNDALPGVT